MLPLGGSVGCWVIQVVDDYFHPAARLVFFFFLAVSLHPIKRSSIPVCVCFINSFLYFPLRSLATATCKERGSSAPRRWLGKRRQQVRSLSGPKN